MPSQVDPPERQTHTGDPRIGLALRLEHHGEGLRLEDPPVLTAKTRAAT
jgi:hypothetical protein